MNIKWCQFKYLKIMSSDTKTIILQNQLIIFRLLFIWEKFSSKWLGVLSKLKMNHVHLVVQLTSYLKQTRWRTPGGRTCWAAWRPPLLPGCEPTGRPPASGLRPLRGSSPPETHTHTHGYIWRIYIAIGVLGQCGSLTPTPQITTDKKNIWGKL